jgi:hypothetical protein
MFERNLFLNHFNSRKPDRSYDRVVVDFQGFRWGYYANENIYENLNSGQFMSAPLFEDMQNAQSDAASSASSSDDGGFGYSNRSKNVSFEIDKLLKGRHRGKGGFERVAQKFFLSSTTRLTIGEVSISDKYITPDSDIISCSFSIRGGRKPYLVKRQWYVNNVAVGGNADYFNPATYNYGDEFFVRITVEDENGVIAARKSETGHIMQPISYTTFRITPERVNVGATVGFVIDGLTGSPYYFGDFSTGNVIKAHYLYVGREIESGFTRAGPQPSSIFDLSLYDVIGGSIPAGTTLGGSVILTNNVGFTQIANTDNTATVIDPNAPVDYDTNAIAITERYRPTTSMGSSNFAFEAIPAPSSFVNNFTEGRWSNDDLEVRTDTTAGSSEGFAAAVPYVAGWAYNDEVWHIMPYIPDSYGEIADGRVKFALRGEGGIYDSVETHSTGLTAAYETGKTIQDWRFFYLTSYTPGEAENWSRYEDA